MNRFLLLLATCLVLGIGALFIVPNYVDWNTYRGVFEDQASRILGREVKVLGNVKLKLLPTPYLEFQKVKVLDKEQLVRRSGRTLKSQPLFADINSFKLKLDIPPLLRGDLRIKKLEMAKPHFHVRFDRNGQANWTGIGEGGSTGLPIEFLPGNVAFDSVDVSDGVISVHQSGQKKPLKLEGVSGELAAESLSGPYRFAGRFAHLGEIRSLNFSTSKQDALGSFRVKSLVDVPATGSRYMLEGELQGFSSIPNFKGVLTGRLPANLLSMLEKDSQDQPPQSADVAEGEGIEIRSNVTATLKRVELKDLSISVENSKRPQSLNGVAILDWKRGFNLQTRLKASWLDLDQMFGNDAIAQNRAVQKFDKNAVQSAANLLMASIQGMGSFVSRAAVHAEISEAQLGGSQLSNFELHLTKNLDRFRISRFSVQLPGRNQLKLSGDLAPRGDNIAFSGPVSVKGISLGALTHWAFLKSSTKLNFQNNPYFLEGSVNYSPVRFEVADLRGDLNGSRVSGRFKYDFAKRKEFVLVLDSDKVDLKDVVDKNTTLKSLVFGMFSADDNKKDFEADLNSESEQGFGNQLAALEGRIKVRVGRMMLPDFTGRDVLVDGLLSRGRFSLRSFKMVSSDGLTVSGKGQITDLQGDSQGNLRFSLEADSSRGLKSFARQLDLPESISDNDRLMRDLSPLRLAITLNMVSGGLPSTDISIAGAAANSQLTINARHEGALGTFGEKQLEISGTLINPDAASLIHQLIRDKTRRNIDESGQGSFSIQASGVPHNGLDTKARLDAGTTQASFDGILRVANGNSTGHGRITIDSSNAAAGLSLVGIDRTSGFAGEKLKLSASLVKKKNLYRASNIKGRIGAMSLSGDGKIDMGARPVKVDFDGRVSEASLPGLLSYVAPSVLPSDLQQIAAVTGATLESTWSNRPFDTRSFRSMQGSMKLRFKKMNLAPKVAVQNGELRASLNDGALVFRKFKGSLFNGPFSATGSMEASQGPVRLKGQLNIEDGDLAEMLVGKGGRVLARGQASLSLNFSGEGLSPLGLVSVMSGRGRFAIREGEIFDFSPNALSDVVSGQETKISGKALSEKFLASLKGQSFPLRNVRGRIALNSGSLSVKRVNFSAGQTSAEANALVELASMKIDSEWHLKSGARSRSKLPGVRLVFAGPLKQIASLPPSVDTSELSQSLAVRQIEKGFDTLQKLNDRDPETIRRLKREQEEKQRKQNAYSSVPPPARKHGTANQDFQKKNYSLDNQNSSGDGNLPALTNLGSIDQNRQGGRSGNNNRQIGSQYTYDNNVPQQDDQEQSLSQLTAEEEAKRDELLRLLEEEDAKEQRNNTRKTRKKRRQKQQEEKSFFDSLFDG